MEAFESIIVSEPDGIMRDGAGRRITMGFFDNIGEKFDNIGEKISKTGKDAVSKTKELAEIAKLSLAVKEEEKKISASHEKIGKEYVRLFAQNDEKIMPEVFDEIAASEKEIATLEERIRKLKGVTICSECGEAVQNDVKYCPKCGAPVLCDALPDANTADTPVCPKCSAPVDPDQEFCVVCGEKIK